MKKEKQVYSFSPVISIGQEVYHKSNGQKGIVIDVIYSALTRMVQFRVAFDSHNNAEVDCYIHELSETPLL